MTLPVVCARQGPALSILSPAMTIADSPAILPVFTSSMWPAWMTTLAGAAAGGAWADSAAGRSARTRHRNLFFINVTSQEKNQKTHICERCADVGHQQIIGQQKGAPIIAARPKAVPPER